MLIPYLLTVCALIAAAVVAVKAKDLTLAAIGLMAGSTSLAGLFFLSPQAASDAESGA